MSQLPSQAEKNRFDIILLFVHSVVAHHRLIVIVCFSLTGEPNIAQEVARGTGVYDNLPVQMCFMS